MQTAWIPFSLEVFIANISYVRYLDWRTSIVFASDSGYLFIFLRKKRIIEKKIRRVMCLEFFSISMLNYLNLKFHFLLLPFFFLMSTYHFLQLIYIKLRYKYPISLGIIVHIIFVSFFLFLQIITLSCKILFCFLQI